MSGKSLKLPKMSLFSKKKTNNFLLDHMIELLLVVIIIALAIVEPALLTYKVEAYLPRLVRFAKEVWGVTGEDDKAVALEGIERMKQFFRSMGVPVTFREVGIDIDKDGRMLAQRIEAFEGGSVYVDLSHEDVYQVYSLAK